MCNIPYVINLAIYFVASCYLLFAFLQSRSKIEIKVFIQELGLELL